MVEDAAAPATAMSGDREAAASIGRAGRLRRESRDPALRGERNALRLLAIVPDAAASLTAIVPAYHHLSHARALYAAAVRTRAVHSFRAGGLGRPGVWRSGTSSPYIARHADRRAARRTDADQDVASLRGARQAGHFTDRALWDDVAGLGIVWGGRRRQRNLLGGELICGRVHSRYLIHDSHIEHDHRDVAQSAGHAS
jgi:hypothetical protein